MGADVPTPGFLAMIDSTIGAGVRCIAKPDRGGDHRLEILDSLPASPDPNVFYQQWLPASTVWKAYTASERLVQAANAVASTLGLAVFNTDFIDNGGLLYAIDVNPFPGLSGLPGAAEVLWSLRMNCGGFIHPKSDRGDCALHVRPSSGVSTGWTVSVAFTRQRSQVRILYSPRVLDR